MEIFLYLVKLMSPVLILTGLTWKKIPLQNVFDDCLTSEVFSQIELCQNISSVLSWDPKNPSGLTPWFHHELSAVQPTASIATVVAC